MIAGVPFMIFVLLIGLLLGISSARLARSVSDSKLARAFYFASAVLLIVSFSVNAYMMLGHPHQVFTGIARVSGSLLSACFAAIFGIAIRRTDSRRLLSEPEVLAALRMAVALTFAIAGIGKAFNMVFMTQFFTQSGYSVSFLNFIMLAEVLGAVGFLLPWAFVPALLGFTIDMFGAIVTHVHNGDPLDDSTGALGTLIRLAAIAALVVIAPRGLFLRFSLAYRIGIATSVAVVCLGIAIAGSVIFHAAR